MGVGLHLPPFSFFPHPSIQSFPTFSYIYMYIICIFCRHLPSRRAHHHHHIILTITHIPSHQPPKHACRQASYILVPRHSSFLSTHVPIYLFAGTYPVIGRITAGVDPDAKGKKRTHTHTWMYMHARTHSYMYIYIYIYRIILHTRPTKHRHMLVTYAHTPTQPYAIDTYTYTYTYTRHRLSRAGQSFAYNYCSHD
jgi:hypothetical protein